MLKARKKMGKYKKGALVASETPSSHVSQKVPAWYEQWWQKLDLFTWRNERLLMCLTTAIPAPAVVITIINIIMNATTKLPFLTWMTLWSKALWAEMQRHSTMHVVEDECLPNQIKMKRNVLENQGYINVFLTKEIVSVIRKTKATK